MASLGEDLRAFLVGSTGLAAAWPSTARGLAAEHVVEQNYIAQDPPLPRIWFQRDNENRELLLDGPSAPRVSEWNVEVIAATDDVVSDIVEALKTRLHGYDGTLGSTGARAALVTAEDHDDDYILRGLASPDEAVSVAALRVTIYTS